MAKSYTADNIGEIARIKEVLDKLNINYNIDDSLTVIVKMKKVDRLANWDKWAQIMHDYIESFTISKYGGSDDEDDDFDLMSITEPRVCIWNILKYSFRLWRNKGKINDLHKISHYAEMAWTLSKGDLTKAGITNEKST